MVEATALLQAVSGGPYGSEWLSRRSSLSSGVARVCDIGLSPQAVARDWVQVRELDTSPDSCCVLLSRYEVSGCMTSIMEVEERVMPSLLFS